MMGSISIPNGNSSWLDRLRSSKGFSISDDPENLDQFLSSNPNPNPNPIPKPPPKPPNPKNHAFFDVISSVLSDLFIMGSPTDPPNPNKASRKQANPRICNGGRPAAGRNREMSLSSVNDSVTEVKRKLKVRERSEGASMDSELLGFSRTEVTVIDTSLSPEWKVARVLYRKGLVWKVGEKKVVRIVRKKRRRVEPTEKSVGGQERKGGSFHGEQPKELLDKGNTQTGKREDFKKTDDQALIPRRQKFTRSPRIPPAKNSNTLLRLKIISKNNGAIGSTNILEGEW